MIKVENGNSEKETIKSEPEDYSPALRFFNNGVPGLGLLTSPFTNPGESTGRRFIIEEYRRELEYRESVLEALESDDESTQSRGVVTPSETGHDDDETVTTQEGEDGCHELGEEREVFMIKVGHEDEQEIGIEAENILPEPVERT
ncbi:5339_t:CDS:2 [Dentiscutata heterogama]|uniref:5339_t:CDS:1 n=1 Tax=Dentiscutata heterogama TaxID=1316150 RepID=A0ACA9LVU4_9GLOM|nr:5339_t:CDS:2 [Dentiscutata heterogama]